MEERRIEKEPASCFNICRLSSVQKLEGSDDYQPILENNEIRKLGQLRKVGTRMGTIRFSRFTPMYSVQFELI